MDKKNFINLQQTISELLQTTTKLQALYLNQTGKYFIHGQVIKGQDERPREKVFLCSPFGGFNDPYKAKQYLKKCLKDSINVRNENPYAPHAILPLGLNDDDKTKRELGIKLGQAIMLVCTKIVVYTDHGKSPGMLSDIAHAKEFKIPDEYRSVE